MQDGIKYFLMRYPNTAAIAAGLVTAGVIVILTAALWCFLFQNDRRG